MWDWSVVHIGANEAGLMLAVVLGLAACTGTDPSSGTDPSQDPVSTGASASPERSPTSAASSATLAADDRAGPSPEADTGVPSECLAALDAAASTDEVASRIAGLMADFLPGGDRDDAPIGDALDELSRQREVLLDAVDRFAVDRSEGLAAPEACSMASSSGRDLARISETAALNFISQLEVIGGVVSDGPSDVDNNLEELDVLSAELDSVVEEREEVSPDFYTAREECLAAA